MNAALLAANTELNVPKDAVLEAIRSTPFHKDMVQVRTPPGKIDGCPMHVLQALHCYLGHQFRHLLFVHHCFIQAVSEGKQEDLVALSMRQAGEMKP